MKGYSEKEMKRILRQDLVLPEEVNDKVYGAYSSLSGQEYRPARTRSYRKWLLVGTAAAMLAVTSLGVLAANGFFTKQTVEQENKLSYDFQMNYELTPCEVKAVPGYIPEGYTEYGEGKYDKDGEHKNGISICEVNAAWLNAEAEFLQVENLKDLEKTTLANMEAHVLTLDFDSSRTQYGFDKRIYLFNPTDGYIVVVYGGNDIPMDELKKVADNLDVTVDESQPLEYADKELKAKEDAAKEEYEARQKAARAKGAGADQVAQIGEVFQNKIHSGVETTVVSARLVDSVEGYAKENFFDYDGEMSYWVNEDGTLKAYERMTCAQESMEEVSRETTGQKILEVKFKAENQSQKTVDYWMGAGRLSRMEAQADGTYKYPDFYTEAVDQDHGLIQSEASPVWIDKPQHTGENRNHFFYRDIQPGETLEYTVLYVVDEDMTGNMYLNFNSSDEHEYDFFVDISVK